MTTMMWSPGGDTSDWKVATIGVAAVQASKQNYAYLNALDADQLFIQTMKP